MTGAGDYTLLILGRATPWASAAARPSVAAQRCGQGLLQQLLLLLAPWF